MAEHILQTIKLINSFLDDDGKFNEIISSVFNSMDIDGGGSIGLEEMIGFIKEVNIQLHIGETDEATIKECFKKIDTNSSDEINKEQFANFFRLQFIKRIQFLEQKLVTLKKK